MAITFDGSAGTISGLTTGGLPSGSVSANDLANNAVTNIKLGYGVVQTQCLNSATLASITPGTTFAEVSSNYRVSITPYFSNSIIKIHYHVPHSYGSGWAASYISNYTAKRFVGGSAQNISTCAANNSNRPGIAGFASRSSNSFDSNDMNRICFTVYDAPATTSTIQYGFHVRIQGGTMYFGYSSSDGSSWPWTSNIIITAQEIKQ